LEGAFGRRDGLACVGIAKDNKVCVRVCRRHNGREVDFDFRVFRQIDRARRLQVVRRRVQAEVVAVHTFELRAASAWTGRILLFVKVNFGLPFFFAHDAVEHDAELEKDLALVFAVRGTRRVQARFVTVRVQAVPQRSRVHGETSEIVTLRARAVFHERREQRHIVRKEIVRPVGEVRPLVAGPDVGALEKENPAADQAGRVLKPSFRTYRALIEPRLVQFFEQIVLFAKGERFRLFVAQKAVGARQVRVFVPRRREVRVDQLVVRGALQEPVELVFGKVKIGGDDGVVVRGVENVAYLEKFAQGPKDDFNLKLVVLQAHQGKGLLRVHAPKNGERYAKLPAANRRFSECCCGEDGVRVGVVPAEAFVRGEQFGKVADHLVPFYLLRGGQVAVGQREHVVPREGLDERAADRKSNGSNHHRANVFDPTELVRYPRGRGIVAFHRKNGAVYVGEVDDEKHVHQEFGVALYFKRVGRVGGRADLSQAFEVQPEILKTEVGVLFVSRRPKRLLRVAGEQDILVSGADKVQ